MDFSGGVDEAMISSFKEKSGQWHLENTTGYIPKWLDEFK